MTAPSKNPGLPARAPALLALLLAACAGPAPEPAVEPSAAPVPARREVSPAVPTGASGWLGVVLPRDVVDLSADRSGRLEAVLVEVGDAVERGSPVARLEVHEVGQELRMAEATLRRAEAETVSAEAEVARTRARHERRTAAPELVSQEELAEAEVELRTAEAALEAARAVRLERRAGVEQLRRRLERSELRAPFAGRISRRYLDAGATVGPGEPVVRLATTETLRLRFAVPPEEAAGLAAGSELVVRTDDGRPLSRAAVLRIAPEIDPVSRQVLVEAVPANGSPGLHAGLGVRLSRPAPAGGSPTGGGPS